jgi:hypothetical protein
MRLESGPAARERNWWLISTIVCVAFSLWFFYDHKIGYRDDNRADAKKHFAPLVPDFEPGESPTRADLETLAESSAKTPEDVHAQLGEPLHRNREGVELTERYASIYGYAEIRYRRGRLDKESLKWNKWAHSKEQIDTQLWWALVPGLFAIYTLWRFIQAATLRVVIDDDGMKYGKQNVPFAKMTDLRDYSPKGWVDLYHTARGAERRLRLDNQKIAKYDEIIEAICQAKGFKNPVTAAAADDADPGDEPSAEAPGESE